MPESIKTKHLQYLQQVNDIKEISIVHLAAYIMYKKSLMLSSRII